MSSDNKDSEINSNSNRKFTKSAIQWRRDMVLSKLVKGHSQADIARELQIHPSTISLDVQFLREKSKKDMESHLSEVLPFIYAKSVEGINNVLKRISEILEKAYQD
jgi:FixJ family two-component response regulator